MFIDFGEWLPDLADQGNPGSTEAKNVLPSLDGYRPMLGLSQVSDALDSVCIGGISAVAKDGTIYNFAGSTNSLYQLVSGYWIARLNHYYLSTPGSIKLTGVAADVVTT